MLNKHSFQICMTRYRLMVVVMMEPQKHSDSSLTRKTKGKGYKQTNEEELVRVRNQRNKTGNVITTNDSFCNKS